MNIEKLKKLRLDRNKKQAEVANALQISRAAYSAYELGKREPDHSTLKKIANYFNVSIDYLLENEISPAEAEDVMEWLEAFKEAGLKPEQFKSLTDEDRQLIVTLVKKFFNESSGK